MPRKDAKVAGRPPDAALDAPLSFFWKAEKAVAHLVELPTAPSKKIGRAMSSIVLAAIIEAPSGRRISYSRRKAFYARPERYRHTDYTYKSVTAAVELLVDAGLLVDHQIAKAGLASGWQSSFMPSPRLSNIDPGRVEAVLGEAIRLKDADGKLIDYGDTRRIASDRRRVRDVNRFLSRVRLEVLPEAGGVLNGDVLQFAATDGKGAYAVNTKRTGLYRVYSGGWTLGGRLYGGWWQGIRDTVRTCILIDGQRVVEVDYRNLHGTMLYAHAGVPFVGDVYAVPGQARGAVKLMFNMMLNATSRLSARMAFLVEDDFAHWTAKQAEALITSILRTHKAVAHLFNSGLGLTFQNIDSGMCLEVLEELCIRRGIPCLPVHDSFVVPAEHLEALVRAMQEAFRRALPGYGDPALKIKAAQGVEGLIGGTVSSQKVPQWEGDAAGPEEAGSGCPSGGPELDSSRTHDGNGSAFEASADLPGLSADVGYWAALEASLLSGAQDGSDGWDEPVGAISLSSVPGAVPVASSLAQPQPVPASEAAPLGLSPASSSICKPEAPTALKTVPVALPLASSVSPEPEASPVSETSPGCPGDGLSQPTNPVPPRRPVRRPDFALRSQAERDRDEIARLVAATLSQPRKPSRRKP